MTSVRRTLPLASILALALSLPALAGGFLPAIGDAPLERASVLTADGRWLHGELSTRSTNTHGITRITLREPDGTRHKLDAKRIERIVAPLGKLARMTVASESSSTIEKAVRTDWDRLHAATEVVFDAVAWPDPEDRVLMQRVNPGFDHRIRVYSHPNWKEGTTSIGSVAVAGDEPNAFVVVREGSAPVKVSKRNYDDRFAELYGDCPEFVASVPEKAREFRDFADQLLAYDQQCVPQEATRGTAPEPE